MGKRTPEFISKIQAEGTKAERTLEREEVLKEARKLVDNLPSFPADRQIYIRNLAERFLKAKVDRQVFLMFVKLTNCYVELQACFPRAQMLSRRIEDGSRQGILTKWKRK